MIVQSELLFQKYKLLLTAFSVRSHWKIISRIWVRIVLFALARSIFLLPASAMQFSYWPWASSAYPKQWTENSIRTEKKCAQKNYCPYQIMPQNIDTSYFFLFSFLPPTFCKASSSSFLFFSSCLLPALDWSSWERLAADWAFWYSSLLWVFSARAFRKVASASCCQSHTDQPQRPCD